MKRTSLLAAALFALTHLALAENIDSFTVQPTPGFGDNRKTASIHAAISGQDFIVEDSPDLSQWNRVSTILKPTGTLNWAHGQGPVVTPLHVTAAGNFFTRRFYRIRHLAPADSLSGGGSGSVAPQGRLTQDTATRFRLVTKTGWTLIAEGSTCTVTSPDGSGNFQVWGDNGHENLNGKHLKDFLGTRRTLLLPGDVTITFTLAKKTPTDTAPTLQTIDIYDDEQTHRINLHTTSIERSGFLRRAGEAAEIDGETARLWDTGTGLYLENIYTESQPANGQPLPQQAVPLARTYGSSQPNRVDDFFDDTRLGHT